MYNDDSYVRLCDILPRTIESLHLSHCNAEIFHHLRELAAIHHKHFPNLKLVKLEMQTTKIKGISRRAMTQYHAYSCEKTPYVALEQISKERGLELFAEIRQLFGSTVDVQVLLLDATINGEENPVWHDSVASARRHFYHGSMSENIADVKFEGFR
jgi:hypothetical protein